MLNFIRNHPYLVAFVIVFLILFTILIFPLEVSLGDSLLAAAVISAVGVGGTWWKMEGFG